MKPLERKKCPPNGISKVAIIPHIDESAKAQFRELAKILADPDQFIVKHHFPDAEWIRPAPWRVRPTRVNFCSLKSDVQYKDQNFTSLETQCPYTVVAIHDPDYSEWKPPVNVKPNAVSICIVPSQKPRLDGFFLGYYKESVDLPHCQQKRDIICTHLRGPSDISDVPKDSDMTDIIIDAEPKEESSTHEEKEPWKWYCVIQ